MIFFIYSTAPIIPHYRISTSQIFNPNFVPPFGHRVLQSFLGPHLIGKKYTNTPLTKVEMDTYKQFKEFSPFHSYRGNPTMPLIEKFRTLDHDNRMTIFFNPLHGYSDQPNSFDYTWQLTGLIYEVTRYITPPRQWLPGKGLEVLPGETREIYDAKLRALYATKASSFKEDWVIETQKKYNIADKDVDLTLVGFGRMAGLAEMHGINLVRDQFEGKLTVIACNSPYVFEKGKGINQVYDALKLGENYFPIKVHTPAVVEKTYEIRPEKWWQRRGLGLPEPLFEVTLPDMTSSWCAPIIYPRMYPWHYLPPFYKWWYRNHPIMVV